MVERGEGPSGGERRRGRVTLAELRQIADRPYRYTSRLHLFGWPLFEMVSGPRRGPGSRWWRLRENLALGHVARGIVAIGPVARGVVAIGVYPMGVLAMGGVPIGVIASGGLAIGAVALGAVVAGLVTSGGVALGAYPIGWVAWGLHPIDLSGADPQAVEFYQRYLPFLLPGWL